VHREEMWMSIVVVGSIAFDDVQTDKGSVKDALGGSALYFSAAASLFAPVHLVGVVGGDFPMEEIAFLNARGVNTDCLDVVENGKTFRWSGVYETDMNKRRTAGLALNVFERFDPMLDDRCRSARYVFLANIDPELQERVLDQVVSPEFVALDTMECYILQKREALRGVLRRIDLLFINDSEAQILTGLSNVVAAAESLLDLGPRYVVVKKGEHGSLLISRGGIFVVPAYPLRKVIDPTGAGDSYAGGVVGYLAETGAHDEGTLRKAVVCGGIVASFAVEGFSLDRLRDISRNDVERRMEHFRAVTVF
jgi:sugar/nucleoside kinase (ribokinase family)